MPQTRKKPARTIFTTPSVSSQQPLLEAFDRKLSGKTSRSLALQMLIRAYLDNRVTLSLTI